MTNKEASFLLGACRPNGSDSGDPEFAGALALAAADPVLAAWIEDQRRFDSAIASRLQSIPVSADLRTRILAGGRVSRPVPWFSARRLWAIAALITLFAGLGLWYSGGARPDPDGWKSQTIATVSSLLSGQTKFDVESPSVADLQQWLHANGSPDSTLPDALRRLASAGCKTIMWNGHPISIICFHGPGGEMVHLAMVDRAALSSPPPEGHPEFATRDGWRMASWSQGDVAMMLITRAQESQLRTLLGMVSLF
jgi:anti-sigma factor RsiW